MLQLQGASTEVWARNHFDGPSVAQEKKKNGHARVSY